LTLGVLQFSKFACCHFLCKILKLFKFLLRLAPFVRGVPFEKLIYHINNFLYFNVFINDVMPRGRGHIFLIEVDSS
jgi:hypothetical protein